MKSNAISIQKWVKIQERTACHPYLWPSPLSCHCATGVCLFNPRAYTITQVEPTEALDCTLVGKCSRVRSRATVTQYIWKEASGTCSSSEISLITAPFPLYQGMQLVVLSQLEACAEICPPMDRHGKWHALHCTGS